MFLYQLITSPQKQQMINMKLLIIMLSLVCLNASAQKDSTKDTVCILTVQQVNEIVEYIQIQASGKADVKQSTWNAIIQTLYRSATIRVLPNKEQLKK